MKKIVFFLILASFAGCGYKPRSMIVEILIGQILNCTKKYIDVQNLESKYQNAISPEVPCSYSELISTVNFQCRQISNSTVRLPEGTFYLVLDSGDWGVSVILENME